MLDSILSLFNCEVLNFLPELPHVDNDFRPLIGLDRARPLSAAGVEVRLVRGCAVRVCLARGILGQVRVVP